MERNNMYKNGIPQFDGQKYAFWSRRMKTYIHAHGFEIWQSVVDGYKEPTVPPTNERAIKLGQNNSKATNALLNGLCESVYTKVIHCKSAKEIWDKLQNIYEGDSKVKETKLQTYRGQFEQLKMKEDENIAAYFLRVDETVNAIIGLGEEIKESVIVQKVLRSLPMRFDPKISTLEEREDLDSISMDELHGIFTAYEMRTEQENPDIKEASFKASKRSKKKGKQKEKEHSNNSDISEDDEEVANFVRRLNKGTNDRYKGKIPLICFNCDGIGHFANKCPHKKNKRNDEDYSNRKQTYKGKRTIKKDFKKILCTKEDISSSDEDEVSDSETERVLFMAVEDSDKEDTEEEYEEAEVDYREELLTAIEVIRREKKKNKKLQDELDKKEDTQELEQMITNLKVQIEEDKRIEEALKEQLEERDMIIGNLEAEIVTLRKDLQKKNMQNNSKVLDDIINSQNPHHDKSRLGYNQTEKGSSSKTTEQETYPKIYAETIKGDRKTYKEDYRDTPPPRRFRFQNQRPTKIDRPQEEEGFIRVTPFRRSSTPRYQTIFFGLCYACNNFGHKAMNCRANSRNINNFESHTQKGYPRRPSETQRRSYNMFESLSTEVECYKCNNFGHMAKYCRMTVPPREPQQNNNSHRQEPQKRTWIRKQNQYSNEECTLALQAKQKKHGWYVDSGCSKHMTGDKDKFLTLRKERDGSVSFGNDDSAKIIGKGTVRIGNKNTKEENVLLVEDMKHNLLSVSQMCDQGHKVTFRFTKV
jgi:hypothetical protein